ncbi:fimbrial protein [Leminorella grimontii]|uniref:fimbrial protein n=1 Tax=Leminorella grimontii TaxID=82981 RepID=UPI00321F6C01
MLKSHFKAAYTLSVIGLCYFSFSFSVQALTLVHYPQWVAGGAASGTSGTCYHTLPELAPLSVTRTLVVDNHLPVGSELFHWGYGEFIPNINGYCIPNGTNNVSSYGRFFTVLAGNAFADANGAFATSIPGIGIKFFITYTSRGVSAYRPAASSQTSRLVSYAGWIPASTPINIEYPIMNSNGSGVWFYTDVTTTSPATHHFSQQANNVGYSIRAVLVKTGNITYTTTPLSIPQSAEFKAIDLGNTTNLPNLIGGGGITIVPPTCRLKTPTDYAINMGRWVHSGPGSHQPGIALPAYGVAKPININLECSGSLDNVYFRFEDAGTSPLSNKNVSLYDGSGTRIDGLEIEMQYGGSRINVDNTTKTDVGAHGTVKTNPQDFSFNSQSTVPFTARYVQRSAIKKGGVGYTGSVTGKVNMYITYQ